MSKLPENITAVIFDLDGVIFDSERAVFNEWRLIAEKYGFPNLEELYAKCIGVNADTCRQIFLDYYGADYADAVVFGDAENDLSMFTDDWTKVAMGNAVDELKAKADYVTTGVDEDGIWNACVHLGLI